MQTRSERCACGGLIAVALPVVEDAEIVRAVRQHQATARHLIWREEGGMERRERVDLDAYERRLLR